MGSFSLSGGVEVYGFISPSDTTDQYPVIDPLYGIDGLRNVDLLSDLDAIPLLRRRAGMIVGVSGTTYYKLNLPPWNFTISDWSLFNSGGFTGGTVIGDTIFTNGLTANTFSASTYLGLPSDIYVSGYSYSNNTFTIERSAGNPNLLATINDVTGLTVNGDLIVTGTTFTDIISATTYQNLPLDIFVTGGTFSGGVITFVNNSGGTFGVSGISSFDTFVTGLTYNDNTLTILQNSGSSISVLIDTFTGLTINGDLNVTGTTYTDSISANTYQNLPIDPNTYITGFSYNNNTFTIGDNLGNTFDTTFNDVTGLTINGDLSVTGNTILNDLTATTISATTYLNLPIDVFVTGGTYNNGTGTVTFTNNTGGTFNVVGFSTGGGSGTFTGGTVTGATIFTNGLTANTISATTYFNLPTDIRVTGVTYNNNTFTYTNNTGGTFSVLFNTVTGLTINGNLSVTGNTNVRGLTGTSALISGSAQSVLTVVGSGTTLPVFSVQGSSGELFSVTDSLIGSLFSVNDISGLPILEAFSDNTILMGNYLAPSLNTTTRVSAGIGTTNIYSIPTSAYTGAFFDYTVSDGTNLRAGNIMSVWSASSTVYSETSTTDIGNTSGITFNTTISGGNAILRASGTTTGWTVKVIVRSI